MKCLFVISILLTICSLGLSDSHGSDHPEIKSSPAPLNHPSLKAKLTCEVDNLIESIAWMHENSTKFSCDPPFSAGSCMIEDGYTVMIDRVKNFFTIEFTVMKDVNDLNWTCSHNDTKSGMLDLDAGMAPNITHFNASSNSVAGGDSVTLMCNAQSETNLTKFWINHNVFPTRDISVISNTNEMMQEATFNASCLDYEYACCASNKYATTCVTSRINVTCPVELKRDISKENVYFKEGDEFVNLTVYYTGSDSSAGKWYRYDSKGNPTMMTQYRASMIQNLRCSPNGFNCFTLHLFYPMMVDIGKYTFMVNDTEFGVTDNFTVTLNVTKLTSDTTTTGRPTTECTTGLSFGTGIGVGIAIGIGAVFFTAGAIYGCRKS